MEKEFVIPSLSLRMRAIGFNEPCMRFFWEGKLMGNYSKSTTNTELDNLSKTQLKGLEGTSYSSAPTWQSAFRWFRKNYNLRNWIESIDTNHKAIIVNHYAKEFNVYEEAELACLEELIKIAENKVTI